MSRGKGRNKAYKTDYDIGAETETLHALTEKNIIALVSQLDYLRWLTRWKNAPSQDDIEAFVDDLEHRLITMIDICQQVQDCIEENEGIRDIIQQWIDNSINEIYQEFIDYVNNIHATNNVAQTVECRDGLYAMIIASHDYIHIANTDFFNAVEALTNVNEFIAQFGEEIVALATRSNPKVLAIATIVSLTSQFIEQVIDTIAEAYEANYTAGVRQEILCDLFCLTQDTCSLSINDIYDYHASKLSLENILTINELLEFIATGVFTGDLVVHAFFVFQIGMMRLIDGAVGFVSAGNISSFASDGLKKTIVAASDEINNDWIVFCDECDIAPYLRLSGNGNAGIVVKDIGYGVATYDSVNDLYAGLQTIPVNTYRSVGLEIEEPIYSLSVQIDVNQTRAGGFIQIVKNLVEIENYSLPLGVTEASYEATVNATTGDKIFINLIIGALNNADGSSAKIIRIEGQYL